jgi:transposase
MAKKIGSDGFDFYFSLGPRRSYEAVATKYGVSKRAVTRLAKREGWQERLLEIERKARTKADEKKVESLQDVSERHLKVLRAVQAKAIEGLKGMSLDTPADILKAIDLTIKQERTILGEPSDRTVVSVEDVIKREYSRWMVQEDSSEAEEDDGHDK